MISMLDKKNTLKEFKAKRKEWIRWFSSRESHSIMQQIYIMIWDAAVFRVINEARGLAPKAKEGGSQVNGMIHHWIDKAFVKTQGIAIRKLLDRGPTKRGKIQHAADGKKGVYSLYGLLDDMEENAHLFTRYNIFKAEGLEYDYKKVIRKSEKHAQEQIQAGNMVYCIPDELNWLRLQERHVIIDKLAGVDANKRTPDDDIQKKCFGYLKTMLEECEVVKTYVDKYVAHASTKKSRESANAGKIRPTLNHFWKAHEIICKVANFIDVNFLTRTGHSFLAIPQYDHFRYVDKPLVTKNKINVLEEVWNKYEKETQSWGSWGIDEFVKEINNEDSNG